MVVKNGFARMTVPDKISLTVFEPAVAVRALHPPAPAETRPQVGESGVDAPRLEIAGIVLAEGLCGSPRLGRIRSQCEHFFVTPSGNGLTKVMPTRSIRAAARLGPLS
jgi:hypothetical protein